MPGSQLPLAVVIIGASGDLARRKLVPALFALDCQQLLPEKFYVFGLARTPYDDTAFRNALAEHLTCRYRGRGVGAARSKSFLARCCYVAGAYDQAESYRRLDERMREVQGPGPVNRLFYMAVPSTVFLNVAQGLRRAGLMPVAEGAGWTRVVVEKPFGRDRRSSDELVRELGRVFPEEVTYRIDHYLGKEVVQNLMVLRFANQVFEPLWNRELVQSVVISWKEPDTIGGRAGYFDQFGIIRDVMQNHLLQILALLTMEAPLSLDGQSVQEAKVTLLRQVPAATLARLVVGQYGPTLRAGGMLNGYTQEPGVTSNSRTPTYAAVVLRIENPRWRGVPFLLEAGKALDERKTEIRIRFRPHKPNVFETGHGPLPANELVVRVQPDETIALQILNKAPGLEMRLVPSALDLRYQTAFGQVIPDAYERLLLDVMTGDRSLFIRADELAASWDVFTPVLHALETQAIQPEGYPIGAKRPEGAEALARKVGVPL